jgi:multicomponent Na+:H+ antiporter subunit E
MHLLPSNLLIAVAWATVAGDFSAPNLIIGFVAGYIALYAFGEFYGGSRYHARMRAGFALALYFLWDLTKSCVQVAWAVLRQHHRGRSRFVRMKLDVESDFGAMLTANLITLTPGTLTVDMDEEKRELLIHAMFADDPEAVAQDLKDNIERRVIEVLR